jgi:hypothetical protein
VSALWFPIACAAIYAIALTLVRTRPLDSHGGLLARAITADLLVTVPALWWLLMVRGRGLRLRSLAPVVLASFAGAALVLPQPWRGELLHLRALAAPAELALMGGLAWVAVRAVRAPRGAGPADPGELPERIAEAARRALGFPGLADLVATEAAMVVYAFAGWRMRAREDAAAFTVHREAGWSAVALGLALAMLAEAFPVHVLASRASPALAWTLTGATLFGLLWLAGDAQALRLRPVRLEPDALLVRIGLRRWARVPYSSIVTVAALRGDVPPRRSPGYLRATVFGDPTVLLELRDPVIARGLYGITRRVTRVGLAPDQRSRFLAALESARAGAGPVSG